ncbi:MAG: DNA polymerase III subunit delta [Candidatus Phytoplasma stylosanthis]|nr:DNA polymerase III subunit delta [Candidatus Phytoplasma stylosanthis]
MKIHSLNLIFHYQKFFLEETKKNLKNICKKNNYHFLFYSIDVNNYIEIIKKIIQELYTSSFFYDKKVLFIENISFLFQKKNINLDFLLNFFKEPKNNIIIYLSEERNNFPSDIQKKIYPYFKISKKYKFSFQDLFEYVKKSFKKDNFFITDEIIYLLIHKTNNNLFSLKEEIKKNKLYHFDSKKITDPKIVEKLVFTKEDKNIFLFIKDIIQKEKKLENFYLFEYLINKKENPFFIIYQILKKLEEMIIVKYLLNEKKTHNDISNIFKYSLEKTFFLVKETNLLSLEKMKNLFLVFFELYSKTKKENIKPINSLKSFLIKEIFNL